MAGEWIKMRADLFTHPKVVRISSALKADTLRTVGGLMSVWCLFDAHSADGRLEGYTPDVLDDHLRWPGFAQAMINVGWLSFDGLESLALPRFDAHNGQSSKRRAQDADRKRDVRKVSASDADKKRTREEKRREEKIEDSEPTGSGAAAPEVRKGTDAQDQVFAIGVTLLTAADVTDKNARSFLAGQCKAHGPERVLDALHACATERPIQPVSRIVEILGRSTAKTRSNPQEALEQSNREVARRWAEGSQHAAA